MPPTEEMVEAYVREKAPDLIGRFDASEWIAFYTAKGWMIGKNKMVDWHGAVYTWLKRLAREAK